MFWRRTQPWLETAKVIQDQARRVFGIKVGRREEKRVREMKGEEGRGRKRWERERGGGGGGERGGGGGGGRGKEMRSGVTFEATHCLSVEVASCTPEEVLHSYSENRGIVLSATLRWKPFLSLSCHPPLLPPSPPPPPLVPHPLWP